MIPSILENLYSYQEDSPILRQLQLPISVRCWHLVYRGIRESGFGSECEVVKIADIFSDKEK